MSTATATTAAAMNATAAAAIATAITTWLGYRCNLPALFALAPLQ